VSSQKVLNNNDDADNAYNIDIDDDDDDNDR
jgi:hypothetical protein